MLLNAALLIASTGIQLVATLLPGTAVTALTAYTTSRNGSHRLFEYRSIEPALSVCHRRILVDHHFFPFSNLPLQFPPADTVYM